ncbi:Sensor protein QseC [bioreactor metagenome]|uniref:histidine kinase n=1 Tax=bioreactor metagenome TaxID=1076179 RepID=A0A645IBU3_9ZZZZ
MRVVVEKSVGGRVLSVQDNGPGVPADELPRLLERFYRGSSHAAEGSGLGLTIVGRIAELHGASLHLANQPSGGLAVSLQGLRAAGG